MLLKGLTILTFLLFSFGQIGRVSFFGQQVNIYLYEFFLLLTLGLLFLRHRFKPKKEFFEQFKIIYIFFAFLFFSFILGLPWYSPLENLIGFLYYLRLLFYIMFFFYIIYELKINPDFSRALKTGLYIFLFFTTATSLVQFLFYPDLRNLIYYGWDPHFYRMFGTFFDTGVAAAVYGLIFLALVLKNNHFIKNKYLLTILLSAYLIFLVLTYSRGAYLAFLLVACTLLLARKMFRQLILLLGIFLVVLILSPKPYGEGVNLTRTFSINSRIQDSLNAVKIWQKRPWLGIGYNRIRSEKSKLDNFEKYNLDVNHSGASFHSSFLIVLVTSGIIGLVLFILMLFKLAKLSEFAKYGVIYLSLMSAVDNVLLHSSVLFLFLMLTAYSMFSPSRKLR